MLSTRLCALLGTAWCADMCVLHATSTQHRVPDTSTAALSCADSCNACLPGIFQLSMHRPRNATTSMSGSLLPCKATQQRLGLLSVVLLVFEAAELQDM